VLAQERCGARHDDGGLKGSLVLWLTIIGRCVPWGWASDFCLCRGHICCMCSNTPVREWVFDCLCAGLPVTALQSAADTDTQDASSLDSQTTQLITPPPPFTPFTPHNSNRVPTFNRTNAHTASFIASSPDSLILCTRAGTKLDTKRMAGAELAAWSRLLSSLWSRGCVLL